MKEKFMCEICKNLHDTRDAANGCESRHLLPVSAKARSYGPTDQAPEKVEILFDNKLGGRYGAMYKFLSWLDKDEEDNGQFHEVAQTLVTEQLRRENKDLRDTVDGNEALISSLNEVIKKQAEEITKLKGGADDVSVEADGKIEYTFKLGSRDIAFSGNFIVKADNYKDAYERALNVFYDKLKLPGSLKMDISEDDLYVVKTNAGEIFEKELDKALDDYSSRHIDIVYNEESGEVCIMYHSCKDSFKIFGIDEETFIFEDESDPEDWLKALADKHNIGYCL